MISRDSECSFIGARVCKNAGIYLGSWKSVIYQEIQSIVFRIDHLENIANFFINCMIALNRKNCPLKLFGLNQKIHNLSVTMPYLHTIQENRARHKAFIIIHAMYYCFRLIEW